MNESSGSTLENAAEKSPRQPRLIAGLPLRALIPNAITSAALCSGLTGIRFAIHGEWEKSVMAVILAGMLDGIDGRVARMLKAQSRFGAELDSLADSVSFGVAPALILFLWSLQQVPRLGWFASLAFAICCVLRLARFNAQIDLDEQPHKSAGFLTGVPAPIGASLAFLPMFLWLASGWNQFRQPEIVGTWLVAISFLLISSVATFSWGSLRLRKSIRLEAIALFGLLVAALLSDTWLTLAGICLIYVLVLPFGIISYAKVKRQRANGGANLAADQVATQD